MSEQPKPSYPIPSVGRIVMVEFHNREFNGSRSRGSPPPSRPRCFGGLRMATKKEGPPSRRRRFGGSPFEGWS